MSDEENEDKEEKETEQDDEDGLIGKIKTNPWVVISAVLLIAIVVIVLKGESITGNVVSGTDAGQNLLNFVKIRTGQDAKIDSVIKQDGFYRVLLDFNGQKTSLFITLDGKYLVESILPLAVTPQAAGDSGAGQQRQTQQRQAAEVPKSDKPKVELFVMTHCPYGTQAEKGLIPAIKALGSKIDAKIRFVHYFMHDPEKTETPRQVCIREEQSAKYLDYLSCFLEDGESDRCISKAGIDKAKMEKCIDNKKSDEYYAQDSQLSNGYGVQGSPTLMINGQIVNSGRDSASMLNTICSAFNEAPAECSEIQLSSSQPSPGFGYATSGADSGSVAQCG